MDLITKAKWEYIFFCDSLIFAVISCLKQFWGEESGLGAPRGVQGFLLALCSWRGLRPYGVPGIKPGSPYLLYLLFWTQTQTLLLLLLLLFYYYFAFRQHPSVFRAYSWDYTQGSFLAGLEELCWVLGIKSFMKNNLN